MYLKHVYLYKRRSNIKNSKRRLTLNHLDAILRCDALILKMARLRFPGRPGQRIGKNYVKYVYDDCKMNMDPCISVHNKIEIGLKIFYELFGYSDEEEEFDGFTNEDLVKAEAVFARSVKTKAAIQQYLETNQEPSSSAASDIEKIFSSSDSDTSIPSFVRRRRGMRDIIRRSYDKMLKHGLQNDHAHKNNLYSSQSKSCIKLDTDVTENTDNQTALPQNKTNQVKNDHVNIPVTQTNADKLCELSQTNPKPTKRRYLMRHLLSKAKRLQSHRGRKSVKPNVKKKFKRRFAYPTSRRYSRNIKRRTRSNFENQIKRSQLQCKPLNKNKSDIKSDSKIQDSSSQTLLEGEIFSEAKQSLSTSKKKMNLLPSNTNIQVFSKQSQTLSDKGITKAKHSLAVGRKRFVLPSMSVRSSRKIIPRRRYMDESEPFLNKTVDDDSHESRSSVSGSSEAISAMDGESSPDDTQLEDDHTEKSLKKIGLLDQPLVVEGKRPWKPSLKIQMKLSEMNPDYPFALKKSMDGSSGTSSGSFKDIIKPDMVSKYAEKMAQKPKEKFPKILEGTKKLPMHRTESEKAENDSSDGFEDKKTEDKLEKVAAKIEKILKSQWEGRLANSSKKTSSQIISRLKTEQKQRTSNQRRTKNILRKARLQIKKRNLRTRQSVKESSVIAVQDVNAQPFASTVQTSLPGLTAVEETVVPNPNLSCAPNKSDIVPDTYCVICGSSKLYISLSKVHEQITCESCNGFFESFIKSPKQYFCKDGKCCIDNKDSTPRRASNNRCKACWIKTCIEKLTVSSVTKEQLMKYVPRLDAPPHNPLLILEEEEEEKEDIPIDNKEVISHGPRIKHVCRRAAVALGLPRATFADITESKESFNLSALPQDEKQKILETVPVEEKIKEAVVETESKSAIPPAKIMKIQGKKKVHKDVKVKNKVHLDLLKKSALLIHKEQKKKKLQMKKSLRQLHKQSTKKSLKLSKKNEMKKTVKFSYKSAVKTSVKATPKILPKLPSAKPVKFRKVRCKECEGCLAEDCGECAYCL